MSWFWERSDAASYSILAISCTQGRGGMASQTSCILSCQSRQIEEHYYSQVPVQCYQSHISCHAQVLSNQGLTRKPILWWGDSSLSVLLWIHHQTTLFFLQASSHPLLQPLFLFCSSYFIPLLMLSLCHFLHSLLPFIILPAVGSSRLICRCLLWAPFCAADVLTLSGPN